MTQTQTSRRPVGSATQFDALTRAADALRRKGSHAEALRAFHEIAMTYASRSDAQSNLAGMLQASGHPFPALEAIARALAIDPNSVPALRNSAEILKDLGEWRAVADTYDAALVLQPESAEVRFARGLQLLMRGEWQEGWREHEQRWRVRDMPLTAHTFSTPRWDGSPLRGRHLLLHGEQGLGDQIQFVRFARDLVNHDARVTLRCSPALVELFRSVSGLEAVCSDGDDVPAHDVHASLMSLPFLLGVDTPSEVDGAPYLHVAGECPDYISEAFARDARPRVGLVWAGNPQHRNDARRSITPRLLTSLVNLDGVQVISLQQRDPGSSLPEPLRPGVRDLGGQLRSFNDTAHALLQLSLLVTVDTSVAHLSGALGVPTLLLVPFVPDWRWMLNRTDTPWYRSLRLVRQNTLFSWDSVLTTAQREIAALPDRPNA